MCEYGLTTLVTKRYGRMIYYSVGTDDIYTIKTSPKAYLYSLKRYRF